MTVHTWGDVAFCWNFVLILNNHIIWLCQCGSVEGQYQRYRIVLKYWDTQRIGTSLKIVKIIILADPKNWTILRKRKNIRNFSDPKNWDGVFGAPK